MDADELLAEIPAFYHRQAQRCAELGLDVAGFGSSHVAIRTRTWRDYVTLRDQIEPRCTGNLENVWNGRPISKLALAHPIDVGGGADPIPLIELIPPFHQRVYRMGLEHVGLVVGDGVDRWAAERRDRLTGQQFQSPDCNPYYVRFDDDYSHVKFYRWSLGDVCVREGASFDRFVHADWEPSDDLAGPDEVG